MRDFRVSLPSTVAFANSIARLARTDILSQRMQTDPPAGVSASPIADNVMTWYPFPFPPPRIRPSGSICFKKIKNPRTKH